MAVTYYTFEVRDAGTLVDSLTPVWVDLYRLSDGVSVSSPSGVAPISEIGSGLYKIAYDSQGASGELCGVIDAGNTISADSDRYISLTLAQDSSRLINISSEVESLSGGMPERNNSFWEYRPSTDPF